MVIFMSIHTPDSQEKVLISLLPHVPFEGWTLEAMRLAVLDAGFEEGDEFRVFQGSPKQALKAFFEWTDAKMTEQLQTLNLDQMRIRDRIATAVMVRLAILSPHKEAVRKTLSTLTHPTYGPQGLQLLGKTVSDMWYAAGDQSTDFNYYSKRTLLAGVYVSTLWTWLDDTSPDHAETRAHLNKRIDQVMQIPKIKGNIQKAASHLCNLVPSFFRT